MTDIFEPRYWCGFEGIGNSLFFASGNTTPLISYKDKDISGGT
jgi:hypothetical protein